MRIQKFTPKYGILISMVGLLACFSCRDTLVIHDVGGVLGETNAPAIIKINANEELAAAAKEGRLELIPHTAANQYNGTIPLQLHDIEEQGNMNLVMILPARVVATDRFEILKRASPAEAVMKASFDPNNGQVRVEEDGSKVLQYNYQTVYEADVIRPAEEALEQHVRAESDTFVTTSIYAVPRSDYIHPLYGLAGEMLTRDWPIGGHPHHRAIFWAWPEVAYGSERGDIYALQRIFARPTGKIDLVSGPVYAQIVAENTWMWEDAEPIVRELAVIRVYRAAQDTRVIDLTLTFYALKDSITLATRNTDSYGGLNLRMMTPEYQDISYHTDEAGAEPRRAWSDFNGIFEGNQALSGLMVLQHRDNPDYPGDWVEYPDLAWVQPTFPAPGTRYPLSVQEPLVLRYRLIVHAGGRPDKEISARRWDAFHDALTPAYSSQ
jgi:hypothetical protein